MSEPRQFPKYLMKIDGERKFLSFRDACVAYGSGLVKVEFGRYVLNEDFSAREMTEQDKLEIERAADKYSSGK